MAARYTLYFKHGLFPISSNLYLNKFANVSFTCNPKLNQSVFYRYSFISCFESEGVAKILQKKKQDFLEATKILGLCRLLQFLMADLSW